MALAINEQVVVKKPQLHGRISEIKRGMVVAVNAESVSVQFPGEFKPEAFPVDQVRSAKSSFGLGSNVENPYEKPIPKLYR
jgi:hypothetical protein